jgi:hypothetical protein
MRKIVLFLISVFVSMGANSQLANVVPTPLSIAGTSVSNTEGWSSFQNPAILGYLPTTEIGIQYENRFLIHELSSKSVNIGLVSNSVTTGISFSHFGYSLYNEMLVGLGFARNFGDKLALGVQFNYYTAYFSASHTYRGAVFPQVGISYRFSPAFNVGFHTFNPIQSQLTTEFTVKRIPSLFSIGTEYNFSPELAWRIQLDKEVSSNYRLATGFEYQMLQSLTVKLGAYGSDYLTPCIGFGLKTGSFRIDLNCELHPLLGLTTMAGIKYSFSKK